MDCYYQNCLGTKPITIEIECQKSNIDNDNSNGIYHYPHDSLSSSYNSRDGDDIFGKDKKKKMSNEKRHGIVALFEKSLKEEKECTDVSIDHRVGHHTGNEMKKDRKKKRRRNYDHGDNEIDLSGDGDGDGDCMMDESEVSLYMVVTDGQQSYHGK